MRVRLKTPIILAVLALVISSTASAAINEQMTYQGVLKDSGGELVDDGSYDMLFKLYTAASGGSAIWTGTHTSANGNEVEVEGGLFSVLLGSGTGNSLSGVDFDQDTLYLGITVGSDAEMTPRVRLGAVPYAFNAASVNGMDLLSSTTIGGGTQAGGLTISGGATTTGNTYLDGSLTTVQSLGSFFSGENTAPGGATGIVNSWFRSGDTDQYVAFSAGDTTDYRSYLAWYDYGETVHQWLMGRNASNHFVLYDNEGTAHRFQADTDSNTYVSSAGSGFVAINGHADNGSGTGGLLVYSGGSDKTIQFRVTPTTSAVNYIDVTGGTLGNGAVLTVSGSDTNADLILEPKGLAGNVGIGTSSPYARLSVIGEQTGDPTFVARATSGQTASILELQSSSGAGVLTVTPAGAGTYASSLIVNNGNNSVTNGLSVKRTAVFDSGASSQAAVQIYGRSGQTANIVQVGATTATGELFSIGPTGNVGIGTTSPYARLAVVGEVVASHFTATTTATSTFAGGIDAARICITGTTNCLGASSVGGSASSTLHVDNNTFIGSNNFLAATTIGDGAQTGGLTISGGATTTGSSYFAGRVAIGEMASTSYLLDIYGANANSAIQITRDSSDISGPVIKYQKGRAGATLQNGDNIGLFHYRGFDGTDYQYSAAFLAQVDGTPSSGSVPGRLLFQTTPSGSGIFQTRMVIASNGKIGIATTTPAGILSITQSANSQAGGIYLAETGNTDFRAMYMNTSGVLSFHGGDTAGTLNTATLNAAGSWTNGSDRAYKQDIVSLDGIYGLEAVLATEPRHYKMKDTFLPQVGFVAQELKSVIPEVVDGEEGSMSVSYGNLVAVAFQAIKDLSAKIDKVAASLKDLVVDTLTARRVEVETLCVGSTCVTETELKMILEAYATSTDER